MNTEFSIDLNGTLTNVYMQVGFFDHKDISYPQHAHPLAEIHILICGTAVLNCNGDCVCMYEGDVVCIPPYLAHAYDPGQTNVKRCTFFVEHDKNNETVKKISYPRTITTLVGEEIEKYVVTGNANKLKPLLSYICSDFFGDDFQKAKIPIANRKLIIYDFFQNKYNLNVTLDDLSRELMISRKQTEREVKRYTGNTFKKELTLRRIQAAIILSETTDRSLSEISVLVGYSSYSGFFKAFKRYLNEQSFKTQK